MIARNFLITAALYVISISVSSGQRFYSVVFSKLPQDYQLYPRDAKDEGTVAIAGILETAGWKYISVQVTRNNLPFKYFRAPISYNGAKGNFTAEAKIKAELAGYDFQLHVCKDADSVLVVNRQNIVSGDVYVLSGQSNSTGFFGESDTNRFCRTFGKITQDLNTAAYNAADTLWTLSNRNAYDNGVGTMGFEIQKQLMQTSGIPNCLIHAGFHWSSAFGHAIRNESNPTDFNTGYGRMLYRVRKAGLANAVKAYIFRQGETEAYHEGADWEGNFGKLRNNLKTDFPGIQKFYVFQIDIIYYPSPIGAILRDYQRRLPDVYPDVRSLATVGTKGFDGLHYGHEGNVQSGQELSRLIKRDFYGSKDTLNINSPSLRKAFYTNNDRKQIILVFDKGQELVYPEKYQPNGNVTLDLKDFIYLDGSSTAVTSGKAEENRIILELNGPQGGSILSYLPMFLEQGGPYYPFNGPYIKNKLGMRAFTFYEVKVSTGLATPVLTAIENGDKSVKLNWEPIPGATTYLLERKFSEDGEYRAVGTLTGQTTEFLDNPGNASLNITYRLKASSPSSESVGFAFAEIKAPVPIILGVETESMFSVFPNPLVKDQPVNIRFTKPVNGMISILNTKGQKLSEQKIGAARDVLLTFPNLSSGLHLIRFKSADKEWTSKILVR
ncbi:sialate O-acetylesterase [Dyadobacter arcticus]|uniref:Sialate O-acetylesterase domain-containing protein n=1 Tax=Dyadobacter arcticus TaxID=1078754 RepID=A0ABX0UL30_9BACT|nr:sialate O-acetylesterase [Dyadobacter arcticus]NIJ53666.1 hypothetical protein [Dyadobacter arcticus]